MFNYRKEQTNLSETLTKGEIKRLLENYMVKATAGFVKPRLEVDEEEDQDYITRQLVPVINNINREIFKESSVH